METELHSTDYIHGRRHISQRPPARHVHDGITYWKDLGREVALLLLEEIRSLEGVTAGAVYRWHEPNPSAAQKADVYRELIMRWERELSAASEYAMVFVDGNGTDSTYQTAHRGLKLDQRRIIEDPIMAESATSQLVQIADLVAWCAFACTERHPSQEFAWNWYEDYIAVRDPERRPLEV